MSRKCCGKPSTFDIMQFDGNNAHAIEEWSNGKVYVRPVEPTEKNPTGVGLQTDGPDGILTAVAGDCVVCNDEGEFFFCTIDFLFSIAESSFAHKKSKRKNKRKRK